MTKIFSLTAALLLPLLMNDGWKTEVHKEYTLHYTSADDSRKDEYLALIKQGIKQVQIFTGQRYQKTFTINIHPSRASLDSQWQKDWGMPEFKSECWMVASGVALQLDMLTPAQWEAESCEHTYSDKIKTQQLITHELMHVYHGQKNTSPDFSNTEGIDWFVEGLATYAAGQCDKNRLQEVKNAVLANAAPLQLDNFWKGKLKYALSGSMILFIDETYGRPKLLELISFNKKTEILATLNTSEQELIDRWKEFITKL